MKARLVFLHGLESGPHGSKYQALRNLDPELISPDCTGVSDIGERLAIIEEALAGVEKMVIAHKKSAVEFLNKRNQRILDWSEIHLAV
jgi:hypothetical protein